MKTSMLSIAIVAASICPSLAVADDKPSEGKWLQLFNGKNLDGWTPKIKGYDLGDNFGNTFRVEDGLLKVRYDNYEKFDNKFGHLFYRSEFSHYRLRIEYRFVGDQSTGGPSWAIRNSGVMLHGQSPETIGKDQDFPVSIEVQFLGGNGREPRPTANLCTPGTHVVMEGKLVTRHCTSSTSKTFHGEEWVSVEIEVRGNKLIRHLVDGKPAIEYSEPQLDDRDANAKKLLDAGKPKMITSGSISLQSESHPIDFRKVELLKLDE